MIDGATRSETEIERDWCVAAVVAALERCDGLHHDVRHSWNPWRWWLWAVATTFDRRIYRDKEPKKNPEDVITLLVIIIDFSSIPWARIVRVGMR